jgi:hypothetical protein
MVPTLKHIARRLGKDIWPVAVVSFALLTGSAALAETACVRCFGPEQVYRCEATADQPIPNQAVGLFCVSRIASEHAHEGCGVQRNTTVCGGLSVTYVYNDVYNEDLGTSAEDSGDRAPNRKANGEPATLGEFTKDTVKASANSAKNAGENLGNAASKAGTATTDAIKGAGNAIGNATKKTLKCLGSALNDC